MALRHRFSYHADVHADLTDLASVARIGEIAYCVVEDSYWKREASAWEPWQDGGPSVIIVEKDLGSVPAHRGSFTITDDDILSTSNIFIRQYRGPYTGKGTRADETEMDTLTLFIYPSNGSALVKWQVDGGMRIGPVPLQGNTQRTGLSTSLPGQNVRANMTTPKSAGRVKGNFKFAYQVA